MKKGTTDHDVLKQYAILIDKAAAILVCNYSSLNLGISLGFAGRNQIASDNNVFKARRGQVNELKELIGGKLAEESPADIAVRCEMINQLVELMLQEEIDEDDLVEFMDDWMEENMNVEAIDASHKQMA